MYHDCRIHLISGYMQTTGVAAEGNKIRLKEDSRSRGRFYKPLSVHSIMLVMTNYRHKITLYMMSVNIFLKKKLQKLKIHFCS